MFLSSSGDTYPKYLAEVDRVNVVDRYEAYVLIGMAESENKQVRGHCFHRRVVNAGDGHLRRLLKDRHDHFEPAGEALVKYWLLHHKMPPPRR